MWVVANSNFGIRPFFVMTENCSICFSDFECDQNCIVQENCGVKLCKSCAVTWYLNNKECPSCDKSVTNYFHGKVFENVCRGCGTTKETIRLDCFFNHEICADCILLHWTRQCNQNSIPTCIGYQECKHTLSLTTIQNICVELYNCMSLSKKTKNCLMHFSKNMLCKTFENQKKKKSFPKKMSKQNV